MRYSLTDEMDSCISNVNEAYENLKTALSLTREVESTLLASSWSGQNKTAIMSLLELCQKLHSNVLEADGRALGAFKQLVKDNGEYNSSSIVMRELKS